MSEDNDVIELGPLIFAPTLHGAVSLTASLSSDLMYELTIITPAGPHPYTFEIGIMGFLETLVWALHTALIKTDPGTPDPTVSLIEYSETFYVAVRGSRVHLSLDRKIDLEPIDFTAFLSAALRELQAQAMRAMADGRLKQEVPKCYRLVIPLYDRWAF
jgi:hypothetical protein